MSYSRLTTYSVYSEKMKILQILLTIIAISFAQGELDVCEGTAQACIDNLLNSLLGNTTENEVCGELRYAINCLEDVLNDCRDDESKKEVKDAIGELEDVLKESCRRRVVRPKSGMAQRHEQRELEEIWNCLTENDVFISNCIYEGSAEALSIVSADASENLLQCAMYGMMAACYVERVGERCGEKAAKLADYQMARVPPEIERACEIAGGIDVYNFNFEDDKRKK